jgi:hypothetical protein
MWKELRVYVVIAASALICVVLFIAVKLASSARFLHEAEHNRKERVTLIRHPNLRMPESQEINRTALNIAPLATVTVSSAEESDERLGGGVADGVVDTKDWVTREETAGAWIKLSWHLPVTVTEVALYDRPNRVDNVLSGTLSFDDGSAIAVPSLPPGGTPWRITFPPKVVHWLMFRIDRAEGQNTGLEEIMVFGMLNP